tara:strand:- start:1198 stop:1509 length:312 start_codon:yes stop_codon:yes gene_type:complete
MSLDHEAIRKAYPSVITIDDTGSKILDASGKTVIVDQSKIDATRTTLNADAAAIAYQFTRQPLYPPLGDFADAMFWNSKGDSSKLTAYYAACEKVKADNPKPS